MMPYYKAYPEEYRVPHFTLSISFHGSYLHDVGGKVEMNGCAACAYNDITGLSKTPFFQDIDLVVKNIIQAFFFIVIKCAHAPAQTQLVYERTDFCKNVQR